MTLKPLVGVDMPHIAVESLKQQLLLVDRIALVDMGQHREWSNAYLDLKYGANSSERFYLRDHGLVFEVPSRLPETAISTEVRQSLNLWDAQKRSLTFRHVYHDPQDEIEFLKKTRHPSEVEFDRQQRIADSYVTRACAIQLRQRGGLDAVSLVAVRADPSATPANRDDALRITLNAFPRVDTSVPISDIVAFKSDADHLRRLLSLRTWISELARGDLSNAEFNERLDFLIMEYREALRLMRLAHQTSTLEVVVTTAADLLDNLLRFKFRQAVTPFFELARQQTRLMIEERALPGHEVSYVVQAQDEFEPRGDA